MRSVSEHHSIQTLYNQDIESEIFPLSSSLSTETSSSCAKPIENGPSDPCRTHNSATKKERESARTTAKMTIGAKRRAEREEDGPQLTRGGRKKSHSAVEHRYREELDCKIDQLHQLLCKAEPGREEEDGYFSGQNENENAASKRKRSDILANATDYVRRSEQKNESMMTEIDFLKQRLVTLEKSSSVRIASC